MKGKSLFEGIILRVKGEQPEPGDMLWVEKHTGASYKEEIVVKGRNGFLGYPDTDSYCRLADYIEKGKSVTVEIVEIKKEGICYAFFMET